MSIWTQADIALALGVTPLHEEQPAWRANGVSIDSRSIQTGQLFVCIRGDRTDGHRYIAQAMQAGAAGVILEESALLAGGLELPEPGRTTVFSVPDGLIALQELARFHRERMSGTKFYGITGSNGKTSAKEMAVGLLGELHGSETLVNATQGNLNNHIGVPLTLLRFRGDEEAVVVEMGMNHAGEIEFLSDLVRPDAALITSVAGVHIEFFENIQGIARAKLEILSGMNGGTLVYPADAVLADVAASLARERNVEIVYNGFAPGEVRVDAATGLQFPWRDHTVVAPAYVNPVMATNLRGVMEMFHAAGFAVERLVEAARKIRPLSARRFEVIRLPRAHRAPILLVDDSYNANPASFVKSLEALRALLPDGRLICVAGEMGELGARHAPAGHRQVGEAAGDLGFEILAVSGAKFAEEIKNGFRARRPEGRIIPAADADALTAALLEELQAPAYPGGLTDFDGVLVKGSRSARMDRAADALRQRLSDG